ncbi:murein hydrolase activator EnvC family protein [Caviibacter abscessus]|uniref:murein hydrolase activator EnvC family protein n=1 Tax=Caviibacter abscessus TaxID=1766719 RepID=UPI0008319EA1|nr:peptidoglycan DD-metalloendopeptidase family protein [Caviibacter abscessus]
MKRLKSNLIFLILFSICTIISTADSQIDKNQKRINQINSQVDKNKNKINSNNKQISNAKRTEADIQKEIKQLNQKIVTLQNEYNILEAKYVELLKAIGKNESEIRDSIRKINSSNEKIQINKSEYATRILTLDKIRRTTSIPSENSVDPASRAKRKHDGKIILELQQNKIKQIEEYKSGVEQNKAKVEIIKQKNMNEAEKIKKARIALENKKKELNSAKNSKDRAVAELKNLQNRLQKENKNIESDNKKLISEKNRLEAQIKAIIAAAQKSANSNKSDNNSTIKNIVKGTGQLTMPINGKVVVGFKQEKIPGLKSNGIEIKGTLGQTVKAADTGTVIYSGNLGNLGGVVIINHGGIITVYGNLSGIKVSKGTSVKKGQAIGTLGRDSTSKDTVLYFETRQGVNIVNPMSYL